MYLTFFGFREKPFNLTPDPRFVYLSENHREAFAHLLYGIDNRAGFIALTGEVGSGKTTVLRSLFNQLDSEHYRTALIFNPPLSPPELLKAITREFGIAVPVGGDTSHLDALNMFLLDQNAQGRIVVLVIDEVQNLTTEVLEQIRLISNLETDKEKLIQIVLSGQPEFIKTLKKKELRQLSQRITVRYHLKPMDFDDTVDYISHRLAVAESRYRDIFTRSALKRIFAYSRGLPRLINAACDRALLSGYTQDKARINAATTRAGIKDLQKSATPLPGMLRKALIPSLVLLATMTAAGAYFTRFSESRHFQASPPIETEIVQPGKTPPVTNTEISRALVEELGSISEDESARRAFNNLALLWKATPVINGNGLSRPGHMERAARDRKLRLLIFSGNMGSLMRMDHPAALEMAIPGVPGKRFISLIGIEDDRLLIDPPIAGRRAIGPAELENFWSGQGFVLWKDHLNILNKKAAGANDKQLKRLQSLLAESGIYNRPLTGVFDDPTLAAVKHFQLSNGIEQDGMISPQTLMFMYRSLDRFNVPRLSSMAGGK